MTLGYGSAAGRAFLPPPGADDTGGAAGTRKPVRMYDHDNRIYTPSKANFANCSVLHFEPDAKARFGVSTALQLLGFGRIDHADRFETLCEAVYRGRFDLLVSEAVPARGDICDLVKRLRHGRFGSNPFPGIIMITARPERKLVLRAIDSGPDHLIRWPFTNDQIGARVTAIVDDRKPFVVTFDYIGPDRRNDPARRNSAMLIAVPNSLRSKARKDIKASATPEAIEAATAEINLHRIRCCYPTIAFAIERLCKGAATPDVGHVGRERELNLLLATVDDLKRRVVGTDYANTASLCTAIASVARRMRDAGDDLSDASFELLRHTGMALHLSFEPPQDGAVSVDVSSIAALIAEKGVPRV